MDPERSERLAKNEALVRSVNERVRQIADELRADDLVGGAAEEFLCECVQIECAERVRLTRAEYERVRERPVAFVVTPGHVVPSIERIVEESGHYWIIEKVGEAERVARATDPRS